MIGPGLSAIALCLLLLFGIGVFSQMFPLRLLAPAWQLRVSGALFERSPLALLGLGLLQLASHLDPKNPKLQARWHRLGRLGVIAVIGFLLLMPVQLVAAARSIRGMESAQLIQQQRVERNLTLLRQQIHAASSFPDLQNRIRDIQAPDLVVETDALNQPLPAFKASLLASIDRSEQALRRGLGQGRSARIWSVLEKSGRGLVSALLLVLTFAAATPQWRDADRSLLQSWRWRWRSLWRHRSRKASAPLSGEEYLRQISKSDRQQ